MRLIKAQDLTLCDFPPNRIPPYAILSHTWLDEEVSLAEFSSPGPLTRVKSGFRKIELACRQAVRDGLDYVWVDTCCTDKSSSAELSEAINSMYVWYKRAAVCYAYLSDVPFDLAFDKDDPKFRASRWFTRGWTLQELLAPETVVFFSAEWKILGDKRKLAQEVHVASGIDTSILTGETSVFSTSVAKRMSWASARETTREEDIAYCLMGLFNVNMPMLYGEGEKAFRRLQEEIMKASPDRTIFVWAHVDDDPEIGGLLARSPRNFSGLGGFEDLSLMSFYRDGDPPTALTNEGISVNAFISQLTVDNDEELWIEEQILRSAVIDSHSDANIEGTFMAVLKCVEHESPDRFPALLLSEVTYKGGEYVRVKRKGLRRLRLRGEQRNILVLHKVLGNYLRPLQARYLQIKYHCNTPLLSIKEYFFRSKYGYQPCFSRDEFYHDPVTKGDELYLGNDRYLVSMPDLYKYPVPFEPDRQIMNIVISNNRVLPSGQGLHVAIGLTRENQIGYFVKLLAGSLKENFDERHYFQKGTAMLMNGHDTKNYYVLRLETPTLESAETCLVNLHIDYKSKAPKLA